MKDTNTLVLNFLRTLHVPIISVIAVTCFLLLQEDNNRPEIKQHKGEKKFKQLIRQFFGTQTKKLKQLDAGKILMWLSLIFVDINMGLIFTILILLLAFINFSATQYIRGSLYLNYCCSSYSYWFFAGAALAVLAYRLFELNIDNKKVELFVKILGCLLGPVLILVKALHEETLLHHAFPFLMGHVITVLMILHLKFSNVSSVASISTLINDYKRVKVDPL